MSIDFLQQFNESYIHMRTDGKRALAPFKPLVQHEARALKLLFAWLGT